MTIAYGLTPTTYQRTAEADWAALLEPDISRPAAPVPPRIFGNFLEHLGFAIYGGVWAELLSNPVFERHHNLSDRQRSALLASGRYLTELFLHASGKGQGAAAAPSPPHPHWTPGIGATGFGVAILDDHAADGIPLPWAPLGEPDAVKIAPGRIGGAIRLGGDGGMRQGIFSPIHRTRTCEGHLWLRPVAPLVAHASSLRPAQPDQVRSNDFSRPTPQPPTGLVAVGLRRRLGPAAGETLASVELAVSGPDWQRAPFWLSLDEDAVTPGEPVDFYIQWRPGAPDIDLLIDRASLLPDDHVDGLDPEVIEATRALRVPLLRWPGGNFVSYYHWRDGVGPPELRPARPNPAWGGLEYNLFGTDEFIRFCRLVETEPHLVVNSGTGTAEEAAAWVEYCNGGADTPMGRLRAEQGNEAPYTVRLWEVGNEIYGDWQGGYHGAEENARRFCAFAGAMRNADRAIELIATGNPFDFVDPAAPGFSHVHADRRWHRALLEVGGGAVDYISLHSLPSNHHLLRDVSDEAAIDSLMAQPDFWQRDFLPDLLQMADALVPQTSKGEPVKLAITEWGILGGDDDRPRVENYGAVPYAGLFLNMLIRNAARAPIANATALLHGGCIRKVAGRVYVDPQVIALREYTLALAGTRPLPTYLSGPGYDVDRGPDLGGPIENVPFVDALACLSTSTLVVAAVNRHLTQSIPLTISVPSATDEAEVTTIAHDDPAAVASPADLDPFPLRRTTVGVSDGKVTVELPAFSVSWIRIQL